MVTKKSVHSPSEDTEPKELAAPTTVGELVGGPDSNLQQITTNPQPGLVVDERVLPDSGLPTEFVQGILDIAHEGSGLLRPAFAPSDRDVYISSSQIRRFNLRVGDLVGGQARRPKENERFWGLLKVEKVNGEPVEAVGIRADFDQLLAIYPDERIDLSTGPEPLTTRIIDLVSPIGFGQRGLIVSPPKAGKTWLLKDIIAGIAKNYPEDGKGKARKVHLMAALIGERPEEVTDILRHMRDATGGLGEVAASNFDEPPEAQTRVAELALERARRLVEQGADVVLVLDSITRLARAYNLALPTSGRTLTGGFDPVALFPAKKFFGAARKIENAGSLTIIGTCLVNTGSRMDDLIYEEFKGTGNMELHLDRRLADKRVFPAIDITSSASPSASVSPSASPSVSASLSPSVSASASPSASVSPSLSPSVSPSASISPSVSPPNSISPSASPSASGISASPSASPSIAGGSASPSTSPSPAGSASPSQSVSVSPSVPPAAEIPEVEETPVLYRNQEFINKEALTAPGISAPLVRQRIPSWNTAGRPKHPKEGVFGFNIQTNNLEYWGGAVWFKLPMKKIRV